jgi:hypothetical protein
VIEALHVSVLVPESGEERRGGCSIGVSWSRAVRFLPH